MNKWNFVYVNDKKCVCIKDIKENDKIYTLNRYGTIEKSDVLEVEDIGEQEVLYIRTINSYIQCPKSQIIYTETEAKPAGEIKSGDALLTPNGLDFVKGIYNKGIERCYKVITSSKSYLTNNILVG